MNDELDTKSDAELNELFAVEVAGWKRAKEKREHYKHWIPPGNPVLKDRIYTACPADFCTDANAVLPWLEKAAWDSSFLEGQSTQGNYFVRSNGEIARGHSFARAAVIALIRAKRATN